MDKRLDRRHDGIRTASHPKLITAGVLFPALFFLAVFFLLPLALVAVTIIDTKSPGILSAVSFITPSYFLKITGFTFYQAFFSMILALVIGLPGGILLGRHTFPGKRLIQSLTAIPFMLPSIIIVLGFVLIYGNNGILNRFLVSALNTDKPPLKILYTKYAIILAHGFYNFPLTVRYVSAYVANLSKNQEQAAAVLGAGRVRIFFTVTLPRLMPALLSAASIIFIFCFLSFALILVLGGGPKTTTLEVEVYRLARVHVDLRNAAVLGAASTAFALAVTYLYTLMQRTIQQTETSATAGIAEPITGAVKKAFAGIYLFLIGLFSLSPLIAVFVKSIFTKSGYHGEARLSADAWVSLFSSRGRLLSAKSIGNSLVTAFAASVIAAGVGLSFAWVLRRIDKARTAAVETLLMLPLGISSILLSLGYLSAKAYFNISGSISMILIIMAHSVIAYPFVLRSILASYRKIPDSVLDSASLLGAGTFARFWTIEFPLVKKALIAAAAFSFAISMGEINASLMLAEGSFLTMPIAIYRLIGSYNFAGACALGTLLIITGAAAFFLIETLGGTDET